MKNKTKRRTRFLIIIICIGIFSSIAYFGSISVMKTLYPIEYEELVEFWAKENNLEKSFVLAVIKCESSFDKNAVSSANAKGLMQITPDTFDWLQTKTGEKLKQEDLFDPEINIKYGCLFYGMLLEKFGSIETAIAGYHAGMNIVSKWLSDENYSNDNVNLHSIPYPSTETYVSRVMNAKNIYQKLY